jgi:uncharacterized protein (DUF885 family)
VRRIAALAAILTFPLQAGAASLAQAPIAPSAYDAKLIDLETRYVENGFRESPSSATDAGVHAYDDRLADYSAPALTASMARLVGFRNELAALTPPPGASVHDRADYLLVRSDIENDWWQRTVVRALQRNPTVYEGECSDGIFSLLKKPFASTEVRVRDAIARLNACPAVLAVGKGNLTDTVREFAQTASEDIADGESLFTTSLDALAAGMTPQTKRDLREAQGKAVAALRAYRAWLDANASSFHAGGFAVGKEQYDWYLRRVLLLPWDSDRIARIGEDELTRDRALEAWEANRDEYAPQRPVQPQFTTKAAFLHYYELQTARLRAFLQSHAIVDVPAYIGAFHIVEVPKALAATYPGGFMNPPGLFDRDPEGFYFVPDYDPKNTSFFAAQARTAVLPVLGHEGLPGHFLQFTYAYHNPDYIRHVHQDEVFAEGWAFYGEEMLMREGLHDDDPAGRKAVIHLMRHRATRVGVDVGLATGSMTLPQAIAYFTKNAGIDEATARGEATRFAMYPGQAVDYLVGKTQIEMLLAQVQDREGRAFSLRRFHDRLLSYGTIPYSLVRWEWLGDPVWIDPDEDPIAPQAF